MATRNFCDRCTKEIEGLPFLLTAGTKEIDLCPDCRKSFEDFVKGGAVTILT